MRRAFVSRDRADLLVRPPSSARESAHDWVAMLLDPVEQLEELAMLRERGVLSRAEFESQKAKVVGRPS